MNGAVKEDSSHARRAEAILAGARQVFLAQGYDGASMDSVAAQAGVTKKTVYNHFPSKEALFNAVSLSVCDEIAGALDMLETSGGNVEANLAQFCHKFIDTLSVPPGREIYRLAIGQGLRFPEFGRVLSETSEKYMQGALVEYLERRNAAGDLRIEDAKAAAEYLLGGMLLLVHRAMFGREIDPGSASTNKFILGAVTAFCRAYAPLQTAGKK